MEKTPNYSPAQESLILAAVAENGGVADKALAERLAANPDMNGENGPRNVRSIIAKLTRMEGVTYTRQVPTTKDGKPVQKKLDLVAKIAKAANVAASKLDGLEKAPKLALETIAAALASEAA